MAFGAKISQLIQMIRPLTTARRPPNEFALDQHTPNANGTNAATNITLYALSTILKIDSSELIAKNVTTTAKHKTVMRIILSKS